MKTRFDLVGVWAGSYTGPIQIADMVTPHILNTVKMLIQNPDRTLSMLIADIESATFSEAVWTVHNDCDKKQSLRNVTSMSRAELVEYAMNSPLFKSLVAELDNRGVNTENVIKLFTTAEFSERESFKDESFRSGV